MVEVKNFFEEVDATKPRAILNCGAPSMRRFGLSIRTRKSRTTCITMKMTITCLWSWKAKDSCVRRTKNTL